MHTAADEIFWATLVLNIPNFTPRISRRGGWYIRWPEHPGPNQHSPWTLTKEQNFGEIVARQEDYLFMRKVEEGASTELLEQMDAIFVRQAETQPEANTSVAFLDTDPDLYFDLADFRCFTVNDL